MVIKAVKTGPEDLGNDILAGNQAARRPSGLANSLRNTNGGRHKGVPAAFWRYNTSLLRTRLDAGESPGVDFAGSSQRGGGRRKVGSPQNSQPLPRLKPNSGSGT